MKKTAVILSLLLVLTLFTACGEIANEQEKQPQLPDSTAQSDSPINIDASPAPDSPASSTPPEGNSQDNTETSPQPENDKAQDAVQASASSVDYDSLTLIRNVVSGGYWTVDGITQAGSIEKKLQYNFFNTNNDWSKENSIVDKMERLLLDIDRENSETAENMFSSRNPEPYKAVFSVRNSEQTKEVIFNIKTKSDNNENTSTAIAVMLADGSSAWLTDNAADEFIALCEQKGLTRDNFIISGSVTSMFDWLCSVETSNASPLFLYDENKELAPNKAAEKLMYEACRELSQPAPNRFFYYQNYEGCNFKLISNKDKEYSNNEYLNIETLTDDQFIITAIEPIGTYTGIHNDGGPDPYFFMEYTNGQWQLWLRGRP